MMRTTQGPIKGRESLSNLGGTDNTTSPKILKNFNHLKVLQTLAEKWVDRGCYSTPDRALRALIGNEL